MSNELTRPGTVALPAAFQGQMAAPAFQGQEIESAADGLEGSYGILKYAGKVWKLSYHGTEYPMLRKDDGTPRGAVDVIFVRSGNTKAKTYYKSFTEGSKERPICWSNDGKRPDPSVPTPPSPTCVTCPMNVFGSRVTDDGKEAKLCSDHKRTAVVLDPTLAQETLNMPLSEPILLRIPAASLNDFGTFGKQMEGQGFPLPSMISRISFDMTKTYPKLVFTAIRPLSPQEGEVSMILRNDPTAIRIVAEGPGGETGPAPVALPAAFQNVGGTAAPQQQTVVPGQVQPSRVQAPDAVVTGTAQPPTENVVALGIVPRMTPEQQAAAMAAKQAKQDAATTVIPPGGGDNFEGDLDAEIGNLLS